ncbi:MAG: GntR family transcriptional regulator, partial [Bacteroidota bacterium]
YLPSENEICAQFETTRGTVRKALDELIKEGYIEKEHGRGSRVIERRKSLGLLTVKGFSGGMDYEVESRVSHRTIIVDWNPSIGFALTEEEKKHKWVYFQRIRYIEGKPIVVEDNWYSEPALELIDADTFIEGSFFKTLSQKYLIEIMGVEHELRGESASKDLAQKLQIPEESPILNISVRFRTSKPTLNLYGNLYCNTEKYPVRNSYSL